MRRGLAITAASLVFGSAALSCSGGWDVQQGDDDGGAVLPTVVGIGITPTDPTVTLGENLQFVATGFFADRTTSTMTDTVEWETNDAAVVTVSSALDMEGLGTPVASGQASVRAVYYDLVSNTVKVKVTDATIETLEVEPSTLSLHGGESGQLNAEATFTDGSRGNVSGSVRWVTGDGAVATVEPTGRVTGQSQGTTAIQAIYETKSLVVEADPVTVSVLSGSGGGSSGGGGVSGDEADLRILGVSAVSSGEVLTYTAQVKNSGGSPASDVWLDVWLNRTDTPPAPPTTGDAYEYIDLLDVGDTTEVSVELDDVGPGNYQSWLMVDSYDAVSEGGLGENNNVWGPETVSVSGGTGSAGADLSITYLQAYVQSSQNQVLYIVDVTNIGSVEAIGFGVGVFANPGFPPVLPATPDEQLTIASLMPGDTTYLSIALRSVPTGWWQSYVVADVYSAIDEPNETNNTAGFQVVAP